MRISNNEKSYCRNRRIMRVVCFFYELMEAHGCSQEQGGKYEGMGSHPSSSTPIASLHDHKGSLKVTWDGPPRELEKRCIERAWHEAGAEDINDVTHEVSSGV